MVQEIIVLMNFPQLYISVIQDVNNVSISNISNNDVRPTNSNIIFSRLDLDYRNCLILNCKNIIKYKCGFLIKKCLTKHTCEVCEHFSMAHQSLNENNLYSNFKSYRTDKSLFGSLRMPIDEFFIFICKLEILFEDNFFSYALKNNILNGFLDPFKTEHLQHSCENFPIIYLLKLFTRLSIYYTTIIINQNFKNPTNKRKLIIWKQEVYFNIYRYMFKIF
jgi:hypothetical protein